MRDLENFSPQTPTEMALFKLCRHLEAKLLYAEGPFKPSPIELRLSDIPDTIILPISTRLSANIDELGVLRVTVIGKTDPGQLQYAYAIERNQTITKYAAADRMEQLHRNLMHALADMLDPT